jgi:hypothetical protein
MRWKVAVQEYNFDVAYIEGHKNVIADGFSRLCPRNLDEDEEQPIRTIAMFLESYPLEEQAIDTSLFVLQGKELKEPPSIFIRPEYEWEAKKCLAERDANIIRERAKSQSPYAPRSNGSQSSPNGNSSASINTLLSVKEMTYYHIPSQFYDIIGKCHNSRVGHWGVEETITKVKDT